MATEKQIRWRVRNRILWEIKGLAARSSIASSRSLTMMERANLEQAFSIIQNVVDNSTQSSRELGFNAVERCKICGKPAYRDGYCKKCYELRNYYGTTRYLLWTRRDST